MKMLNKKFVRTLSCAAVAVCAAAMLSVGAFAAEVATFRTTIEDMQTLQANGVKTLVLVTEKNTTTLNLSLLCEGQKSGTRVTLRQLGSNATLSVGLRCRRDLLIGR